jgi:hypothetical protein
MFVQALNARSKRAYAFVVVAGYFFGVGGTSRKLFLKRTLAGGESMSTIKLKSVIPENHPIFLRSYHCRNIASDVANQEI